MGTIVEEVPGLVHTEDMTTRLQEDGYFPSFNVPFFPVVQEAAGYSPRSWTGAARYCLFKELQGSVQNPDTMEAVMRWNDYKHSSCSRGSPTNAIAARGDLGRYGSAFGALDAKWTDYGGAVAMRTYAQAGPTHDTQKEFCW